MITDLPPRIVLSIGFLLLLASFVLPLLIVMQVVESTLFLNFLSFFMMVLGSILGFIGSASLALQRRRK
jgi:hypothetical protein